MDEEDMKPESWEQFRITRQKLKLISDAIRKHIPELSEVLDDCVEELSNIELAETIDAIVKVQEKLDWQPRIHDVPSPDSHRTCQLCDESGM